VKKCHFSKLIKYAVIMAMFVVILFRCSNVHAVEEELPSYFNSIDKVNENMQTATAQSPDFDVRSHVLNVSILQQGEVGMCPYCSATKVLEYSIKYQGIEKNFEPSLEHMLAWHRNNGIAIHEANSVLAPYWYCFSENGGPISYEQLATKYQYTGKDERSVLLKVEGPLMQLGTLAKKMNLVPKYQINNVTNYKDFINNDEMIKTILRCGSVGDALKTDQMFGFGKEEMKKAIVKYGAVGKDIQMDMERSLNFSTGGMFHPILVMPEIIKKDSSGNVVHDSSGNVVFEKGLHKADISCNYKVNHIVAVIGWDDDFKKENFEFRFRYDNGNGKVETQKYRPTKDGAWIVLNSWGEDWGAEGANTAPRPEDNNNNKTNLTWAVQDKNKRGIFYVSYEDYFFNGEMMQFTAVTDIKEKEEYNKKYQSAVDVTFHGYTLPVQYIGNLFNRENSNVTEYLTHVAVYGKDSNETIDIYFGQGDDLEKEISKLKKIGSTKVSGFQIVKINPPIKLTGKKFDIRLDYTRGSGAAVSFGNCKHNNSISYAIGNNGQIIKNVGYKTRPRNSSGMFENEQMLSDNNWSPYIIAYTDVIDYPIEVKEHRIVKGRNSENNTEYYYELKVETKEMEDGTNLDVHIYDGENDVTNNFEIEGNQVQGNRANIKVKIKDDTKMGKYTVKILEKNTNSRGYTGIGAGLEDIIEVYSGVVDFFYKGVNNNKQINSVDKTTTTQRASAMEDVSITAVSRVNEDTQQIATARGQMTYEDFKKRDDIFYYSTKGKLIKLDGDKEEDAHVEYQDLISEEVEKIRTSSAKLKNEGVNEKAREDLTVENPYGEKESVATKSNTIATYNSSRQITLDAQEAYILAHAKDMEWDSCKVQEALLKVRSGKEENVEGEERKKEDKVEGQAVVDNLVAESEQFKDYTEKLEEFKKAHEGKALVDLTDYNNINKLYDGDELAFITGPFKVDYVKASYEVPENAESEVAIGEENKKKEIEFGKIADLEVYADSRKDIELDYEIIYQGNQDKEKDKYPEPNEEFYLKINYASMQDEIQVSKLVFTLNGMKSSGKATLLSGTYKEIEWVSKEKEIRCTKCGSNLICEHGHRGNHQESDGSICVAKYCGYYYESTGELRLRGDGHIKGHEYWLESRVAKEVKAPDLIQVQISEIWKELETVELNIGTTESYYSYTEGDLTPKLNNEGANPSIKFLMNIKGNVFEDNKIAGTEIGDGVKGGEKGLGNIEVYLFGSNGVMAKATTDESGNYEFIDVPAGDRYSVYFEYDGFTYESTKVTIENSPNGYNNNASHAEEDSESRESFNDRFSEFINDAAINVTGTTIDLEYESTSTVNGKKTTLVTKEDDGIAKSEFKMEAKTSYYPITTSYAISNSDFNLNEKNYDRIYDYMDNVNLGLVERVQGEISVIEDIDKFQYTVQQKYAEKSSEHGYGSKIQTSSGKFDERGADYFNKQYTTPINQNDWEYRHTMNKSDKVNQSDELQAYVTYKMVFTNNAQFDTATLNELVTHYDSNFTYSNILYDTRIGLSNSWCEYNGATYNLNWATSSQYSRKKGDLFSINYDYIPGLTELPFIANGLSLHTGYKTMYCTDLSWLSLKPGEKIEVYIRYKINKDARRSLYTANNHGDTRKSVTEINGYSYTNGKISQGSNPGNANPGKVNTYEGDTDQAPDLAVNVQYDKEGRTITGYVWEDNRTQTLSNNKLVGNGIMENNETKIDNVLVELIPMVWDSSKGEYVEDEFTREYKHTTKIRTSDGYYKFDNLHGGVYKIRYTYGDEEQLSKTVDRYISTKYNGHDYQSTIFTNKNDQSKTSKARDNEFTGIPNTKVKGRNSVLDYSSTMTYENAEVLDVEEINSLAGTQEWKTRVKKLAENTTMTADSINVDTEIYSLKYEIPEINLGLVERPRQEIEIKDEVDSIRIVLSDGTEIINTSIDKNQNVQNILNEKIIAYMDKEIMQGATIYITYKITVSNVGEIDTMSSYFATGSTDTVPTRIGTIYSHYDNAVFRATDNAKNYIRNGNGNLRQETAIWTMVANLQLQNKIKSQFNSSAYKTVETSSLKDISIYPKESNEVKSSKQESEVSVYLTLSKVISSSEDIDSLEYDNYVEIVKRISTTGRRDYNGVTGNYMPGTEITERDTDKAGTVTIMPPFGGNKIVYYSLALGAVSILACGIVFIKKKVI